MPEQTGAYRVVLRTDAEGPHAPLDDVVVNAVSMFRAEMMSDKTLWMRCYLPDTGVEHDYLDMFVTVKHGRLHFTAGDLPSGDVTFDKTEYGAGQ